jgi:hypothetical protein
MRTLIEYPLGVDIDQADIPTNIAWVLGRIRRTPIEYSVGVDIG